MKKVLNTIFGIKGTKLSDPEKEFFKKTNPLGFILFSRNINDKEQVKQLVDELKESVQHNYIQILIDQEGGRVCRLKPPLFRVCKPAGLFGKVAERDLEKAKHAAFINSYLIGIGLRELGINVNCAPVSDLLYEGANQIVGDRSFGKDINTVIELCKAADLGFQAAGVQAIMKHIPGHGRANADSHFTLPIIDTNIDVLEKTDLAVFKNLHIGWAMTAHVVYKAIDKTLPATLSKKVINYIRNNMNYNGILISDDLVMKALSGDMRTIINMAQDAGCDILLHCNANLEEMTNVASVAKHLHGNTLAKIKKPLNSNFKHSVFKKWLDSSIIELEEELSKLLIL